LNELKISVLPGTQLTTSLHNFVPRLSCPILKKRLLKLLQRQGYLFYVLSVVASPAAAVSLVRERADADRDSTRYQLESSFECASKEQSGGYILIAQKDDAKVLVDATPYVNEFGALSLDLSGSGLTGVDGIKDLTDLQTLDLSDCSHLINIDGLKGLTNLQTLYLDRCNRITNV
jgi:hypothetical protein